MGLLDDVIGAATGSKSGSALSSPIAMALMALLASKVLGGGKQGSGLGPLLEQLNGSGLEDIVKSWIGSGPNKAVSPSQLHQALGQDAVDDLAEQTGLPHDDLLAQLSKILPGVVDQLTPHGRVPSSDELLPGPR